MTLIAASWPVLTCRPWRERKYHSRVSYKHHTGIIEHVVMRSICGRRMGGSKPLWHAASLRNSLKHTHTHTRFLEWLKQTQKPVWMISGSWLYHFVFVNVCVLQCHQMTTLFGLDESPKALRNRRNVEMEITVPGLPQFPPVYLLSSSLPPSSILFHNQKREKQTLRMQIICALSRSRVLGQ